MASIKFSAIVSDAAGKVGAVVFQKNSSGSFVRITNKPINKRTAPNQYQRLSISQLSQDWRNLTEEERQSWSDVTSQAPQQNRVGDTVFLTGFQLFMKTNLNLFTAAYSL